MTTKVWVIIKKVATLVDGSINVTLNFPESAIPEAAELMAYQIHGVVLDVTFEPRQENEPTNPGDSRKLHI